MKIVIDIPTDQYNEIVYVNYERLRDIVRDGVVIEKCEDAISREAVIDGIDRYIEKTQSTSVIDNFISFKELVIKHLPSITPQRPKGKWIHPYKSDIACECSECHIQMPITNYYHYCPNCGAEMSEGDAE